MTLKFKEHEKAKEVILLLDEKITVERVKIGTCKLFGLLLVRGY